MGSEKYKSPFKELSDENFTLAVDVFKTLSRWKRELDQKNDLINTLLQILKQRKTHKTKGRYVEIKNEDERLKQIAKDHHFKL